MAQNSPDLLALLPTLRLHARLLARLACASRASRAAATAALTRVLDLSDDAAAGAGLRALAAKDLRPSVLRLQFARNLTDSDVLPLLHPALLELNLNAAQSVGDATVVAAARLCPRLTRLGLYWNIRLTDAGVAALGASPCATCLSELSLSGCKALTDAAPLSCFPALTSLDLTRCPLLSDESLRQLSCRLTALVLYADAQFSALGLRAVLSAQLPSLERLDLCGCALLTDGALLGALGAAGAAPLPLTVLNLTYCVELSDLSLKPLLRRCPRLEWLSLHGLPRVTPALLGAIAAPRLAALDVRGCGAIPLDQRRPAALTARFPTLRAFTLHG